MSQSHKHSHHFHLVLHGAKVSLFLSFVVLLIGLVLGYLSPASRSPLFGWTKSTNVYTAQGPDDLRPVSAVQRIILLTAKSGVFTPSKINVSKNEVVSIQLKSEDRAYSFFLPSKDAHVQFDASKSGQLELSFDREGTYPFTSSIYAPGYETTRGTIAVSSTPN